MTITYRGTTALITGASSGLGTEYATRLAARGADVVLVARREDRLRELAERLERSHGVTATVIPLDLGRPGAAKALRRDLDERGIRIGILVNNAGFGLHGDFLDADEARTAEMIQLNISALVELTRAFLPDLVRERRGAVVNIASTGAFQPCPSMAVYGATKAFVLNFTEAIAYETRDAGVAVLAVCPGATATEFREVSGLHADRGQRGSQTPAEVVAATLRALDRGHSGSVVSGARNAVLAKLAGIMPRPVVTSIAARTLA
ncbi:SDR family oxidoreductase [Sinomonas sp. JGH33]|uniref:SDR family oxidoreductase n=1 Tax=Sinomonas terricola TaxID=3110330 RepID=A0ABU5T2X5_9MICC|nr:SDR family oxidoreductase [Sinomonas sp. JGH33]MEA5454014.1 SDR family oxidoreductase [Sinomonas sp. JGH33]